MNKILLLVFGIAATLVSCNNSAENNEQKEIRSDFVEVEISWDTSSFVRKYRLTNTEFSLCLAKSSTNKDSCIFKSEINNQDLFKTLKEAEIEDSYMNESSYYSNGFQKITIFLDEDKKEISVQDFTANLINFIRNRINSNLPLELKNEYKIKE